MSLNKLFPKNCFREYVNIVIAGLAGGYIALYLNFAFENNPNNYHTVSSSLLLVVMVLILAYFMFRTVNYTKDGRKINS